MNTEELVTTCPSCGRTNEFHDGMNTARPPRDGALSICFGCHNVAVFVAGPLGLGLRLPAEDERAEILADPDVRDALTAMRALKASLS